VAKNMKKIFNRKISRNFYKHKVEKWVLFYKTKSNLFDKLIFIFYLINNLSWLIRFKLLYVILDMAQMAIIIILYFID
jgi:hypothetical protein